MSYSEKNRMVLAFTVMFLLNLVGSLALSQTAEGEQPTFSSNTNLVQIPLRIFDQSKNKFVTEFDRSNLIISDNGKPMELVAFDKFGAKINFWIVVDVSGSMSSFEDTLEESIAVLIDTLPKDSLKSLVGFTEKMYLHSGPSADADTVKRGLSKLSIGGGTSIWDALAGVTTYAVAAHTKETEQNVIILLTDGFEGYSLFPFEESAALVKQSGITVFPVIFGATSKDSASHVVGYDELRRLAFESGGDLFTQNSVKKWLGNGSGWIKDVTKTIEKIAGASALVMAKPSETPVGRARNTWRQIRVTTKGLPNAESLAVFARSAYCPTSKIGENGKPIQICRYKPLSNDPVGVATFAEADTHNRAFALEAPSVDLNSEYQVRETVSKTIESQGKYYFSKTSTGWSQIDAPVPNSSFCVLARTVAAEPFRSSETWAYQGLRVGTQNMSAKELRAENQRASTNWTSQIQLYVHNQSGSRMHVSCMWWQQVIQPSFIDETISAFYHVFSPRSSGDSRLAD
jgi:hypothetical protein